MSELKVYKILGIEFDSQFYHKPEADKVIAELEKNLSEIQSQKMQLEDDVALLRRNNAELKETLKNSRNAHKYWRKEYLIEYKECLHHKYKRCLAMARWCASRSASWCLDPADEELHKSDFYDKWKLRWLELAKRFKEG